MYVINQVITEMSGKFTFLFKTYEREKVECYFGYYMASILVCYICYNNVPANTNLRYKIQVADLEKNRQLAMIKNQSHEKVFSQPQLIAHKCLVLQIIHILNSSPLIRLIHHAQNGDEG